MNCSYSMEILVHYLHRILISAKQFAQTETLYHREKIALCERLENTKTLEMK